jgi:hypothetical protein
VRFVDKENMSSKMVVVYTKKAGQRRNSGRKRIGGGCRWRRRIAKKIVVVVVEKRVVVVDARKKCRKWEWVGGGVIVRLGIGMIGIFLIPPPNTLFNPPETQFCP